MSPSEQARKFYGAQWWDTLGHYACHHFVWASPTCICLAKPEGEAWWIEFYAGDMLEILNHMPYWLPQIRFNRRGSQKAYWTANLVRKLLRTSDFIGKGNHDSVQDGPSYPVPRWRWQQPEATETASSARTYYCRRECGQERDNGAAA